MRLHKLFLAYLPTKIPVGMTAFKQWLDSICDLAGPVADTDSMKWVISNEVMRIKSGQDRIPKIVLVKTLRKYAANQLAGATVIELKEKQEAANAAKQAEATALSEAAACQKNTTT